MTNGKPYIALCKEDETAFVNARTFWALTRSGRDESYELRVRHGHPEDTFSFLWLNRAERDDITLLSPTDFEDAAEQLYLHEDVDPATLQGAREELMARGTQTMTAEQANIYSELKRHWDAFSLLFNPVVNL